MKRIMLGLLVCAGMASAEETIEFDAFHSVEVRNDIVATVGIADEHSVLVSGDDADFAQLITAQFGDWVRFDRNTRWLIWTNGRQDRFEASIEMPAVRELKALSGAMISADLGAQDQFRAEAENGTITVSVDTPNLRLRGNDNAVITVDGTCGRLTMLARPTSTVDLNGLACDSIVIFGDQSRVLLPDGANVVDQHPDPDS